MEERTDSRASFEVAPWYQVVAGVTPLFLVSLAVILRTYVPGEVWDERWASFVRVGAYGSAAAALVAGWLMGFPRWFYLYPGLVLVGSALGLWWAAVEGGVGGGSVLGVVLGGTTLLFLLILGLLLVSGSRSRLVKRVRRDWTLVSCVVYGLMPLVQSLAFEDAHRNNQTVYLMVSAATVVAGAVMYLRGERKWQRALTLVSGMTIVLVMGALDRAHFAGGLGLWLAEPGTWREELPWFANLWAMVAGAMVAPALLSLVPGAADSRRTGASDVGLC